MPEFETDKAAIAYGVNNSFSDDEFQNVMIQNDQVILCGTCKPFEDPFYIFSEGMLEKFHCEDGTDAADLRDILIDAFEKYCNVRFLTVNDIF